MADPALHVNGLWKVFGPRASQIPGSPDAALGRELAQALLLGETIMEQVADAEQPARRLGPRPFFSDA